MNHKSPGTRSFTILHMAGRKYRAIGHLLMTPINIQIEMKVVGVKVLKRNYYQSMPPPMLIGYGR